MQPPYAVFGPLSAVCAMGASPSLVLIPAVTAVLALIMLSQRPAGVEPIHVGVVHALSGPMAESERGLVDAARLAVEEINAEGGLLGRRVDLILADSRSDWMTAATEVERLILQERVSVLFACWTSACRKAVTPVVEKHRHLMFYPLQYEGLYAVWGYFQSLPDPANRRFVDAFRRRFGAERVVSDPIVSSYNGVRLWAAAVRAAGTDDPETSAWSMPALSRARHWFATPCRHWSRPGR